MMEEPILEEPHTIFISVPDTVFNQELFDELPNDRVEDESLLSSTVTVTKEELIGDESDPLTSSINTEDSPEKTQCIIKEEIFIDQDEQCVNKNVLSHTKTEVNEQVAAWEETDYEDHGVPLKESESSSSLLRFLLLTQRDQRNVKKQEYVCEVCKKAFMWCSSFYQHKLMNHCQKSNQNDVCNDNSKPVVTTDIGVSLAHRSNTVSEDRPMGQGNVKRRYVCDVCNKEFRWHSSFRRHKLMHYRQMNNQHDVRNNDNTTDHRKSKKRYVCDVCNKVIRSQRAFCRHKIMHHRQMTDQNDICNDNSKSVVTTEIGALAHESSTVSEDRPNVCAFIQSGTLSKHKLDHSGVEKYKCEVCDETFSEWSLLTTHKLVCNDITHCNECGESFTNMNDLLEHEVS